MFDSVLTIALGAILINNFIFSQFLGCCPFLGCSTKIDTALGMGLAVTFVMGLASAICYAVNTLLIALDLEYMSTLAFILVIAVLVQFVEMFLKKSVPSLYTALGIFLPLITTNCAVLGVVLLNVQNNYNFIERARQAAVCRLPRELRRLPDSPRDGGTPGPGLHGLLGHEDRLRG